MPRPSAARSAGGPAQPRQDPVALRGSPPGGKPSSGEEPEAGRSSICLLLRLGTADRRSVNTPKPDPRCLVRRLDSAYVGIHRAVSASGINPVAVHEWTPVDAGCRLGLR